MPVHSAAMPGHPAAESGPAGGAEEVSARQRGAGVLDVRQWLPALPGENLQLGSGDTEE